MAFPVGCSACFAAPASLHAISLDARLLVRYAHCLATLDSFLVGAITCLLTPSSLRSSVGSMLWHQQVTPSASRPSGSIRLSYSSASLQNLPARMEPEGRLSRQAGACGLRPCRHYTGKAPLWQGSPAGAFPSSALF